MRVQAVLMDAWTLRVALQLISKALWLRRSGEVTAPNHNETRFPDAPSQSGMS